MRLLILGTGNMAATHARAFAEIPGVTLAACVDTNAEIAARFAATHGIARSFGGLGAALEAGGVDAVVNTTPDAAHYPTTMAALAAGLHVFCEKPLATHAVHAAEMTDAAAAAGVVNGVNLTYRNVSALQKARELIAAGAIGEIRHFEASYLQSWLTQPAWGDWRTEDTWLWRLSTRHGSLGVLGDIGIHIFDFATFAAGSAIGSLSATLTTFDKAPGGQIGDYVLDANDSFTMTAALESGATGVIHASRFASGHMNDLSLRIFGTEGGLRVTNAGPLGTLEICSGEDLRAAKWTEVALAPVTTNYRRFAEAVARGEPMIPDFATATRLQRVIDAAVEAHTTGVRIATG